MVAATSQPLKRLFLPSFFSPGKKAEKAVTEGGRGRFFVLLLQVLKFAGGVLRLLRFDGKRFNKRILTVREKHGVNAGRKNYIFQLQFKGFLWCKLNVFKFRARQDLIIFEQRENEILFTGLETEDADRFVFKIEPSGKEVSEGINA